jgi:hypothetical protein
MVRIVLRVLPVALLLSLVDCTSPRQGRAAAPSSELSVTDQQLSVPLMTAQIVSIKGAARLRAVHGVCFIVRDDTGSEAAREGESLRDGDLLDLGDDDCSVKIRSSAKSDIVLRRENGRFFRLEIKQ